MSFVPHFVQIILLQKLNKLFTLFYLLIYPPTLRCNFILHQPVCFEYFLHLRISSVAQPCKKTFFAHSSQSAEPQHLCHQQKSNNYLIYDRKNKYVLTINVLD